MRPETKYTKSGSLHIAYRVFGDGPLDLVIVPGFISNVELWDEEPEGAALLEGLARFARVVVFDKRGTGLSDRFADDRAASIEQRMDDVRAVLDAVSSEQAAIMGVSEGGAMSAVFAATYPERTRALILYGSSAAFPWGRDSQARARVMSAFSTLIDPATWGQGVLTPLLAASNPSDERLVRWCGRWERLGASPGSVGAIMRMLANIDIRAVLPSIHVPTLVLHRERDPLIPASAARYTARQIPGAKLVLLAGADHAPFVGDTAAIVAEVEEFLTGSRTSRPPPLALATILFSDIVDSTARAAALGDRRWRDLLDEHDAIARAAIEGARGRFVKSTGDGVLAVFEGPGRAVRAALALREGVERIGLELRIGLHTGEVERRGDDVCGLSVHIAARVMAEAQPGEVLVTGALRDIADGTGVGFEARGARELKGVPERHEVFVASG